MPEFGYHVIAGSHGHWGEPNVLMGCKFTSPADIGTIASITAYLGTNTGGSMQATAAIYSDADGYPADLLATTNAHTVASTPNWVPFDFASPFQASPNTVYWLAVFAEQDAEFYMDTGVANQTCYDDHFIYPSFPAVWENFAFEANIMSIYATYNLATAYPPTTVISSNVSGNPATINLLTTDPPVTLTAVSTPQGGSGTMTVNWYPLGLQGTSIVFDPATMGVGTWTITATSTDSMGEGPASNTITISVSLPNEYTLAVNSEPITGVPFTIE